MSITRVRDNILSVTLTDSNVKRAVKSFAMSKRYMNTMLRATIINIMYHRLNIEDREFKTKVFNNVSYKTFRAKSNHLLIREFHTYMLACKDALDKNYLREFYMYFMDLVTGEILENYKFSFQYGDQEAPVPGQKYEDLTKSTCELLQNLEDFAMQKKLDVEIQVRVEFTYFDDTPDDYEPPGFRRVQEDDSILKKLGKSGNSITIGKLFTGFHTMKCRGRGQIFEYEGSPLNLVEEIVVNEVGSDQAESATSYDLEGITQCSTRVAINSPIMSGNAENASCEPIQKTSGFTDKTSVRFNDTYLSGRLIDISDEESVTIVECPCKFPFVEMCEVDKVSCTKCERIYHAPCQGYLDESFFEGTTICCNYCNPSDAVTETIITDGKQTAKFFLLRYIVAALYKYGSLPETVRTKYSDLLEQIRTLNLFPNGESPDKFDIARLSCLFNFDYKMPDMNKITRVYF